MERGDFLRPRSPSSRRDNFVGAAAVRAGAPRWSIHPDASWASGLSCCCETRCVTFRNVFLFGMSTQKKPKRARQICALDGCTRTFEIPHTGRKRHYCCDVHRAQASRQRRQDADPVGQAAGRATAFNAAEPGERHLVVTTPRSGNPQAEGAAVASSNGAAHQRGAGTSTVRYSTEVVMHVRETREEVPRG